MSEKRKDKKGRVLRTGESQRKDLIYQYRYTDIRGKRQTIYSSDLKELREKEKEIQAWVDEGLDYAAGNVTVTQLVERYISIKQGVRYNTKVGYSFVLGLIKKERFGNRVIRDIKVSDAQQWMIKLQQDGKGYSTLTSVRGVLKPAFQMAYNEDVIRRNPFDFKLTDVVVNDSKKRIAMTEEQQELWMGYIKEDSTYSKYYDEFVVLLETGMRVSEFCGLTVDDVDLERNVVRVEHQLLYYAGKLFIEAPKTKQGVRTIPMSAKAKEAFEHMIAIRPRLDKEPVVDGYSGFFQITPYGKPRRTPSVEANLKKIIMKYNESHPQDTLPLITPHSLRHMFCTRLVLSGMNLKAIQYIMGHKKMEMTLELYSHMNEKNAIKAFRHYMASDTNFDTNFLYIDDF